MAYIGYIVWFINGDPKFHFVAKTAKDEVNIISEFDNNSFILPAPNILQGLWKVPVVESDLTAKEKQLRFTKFTNFPYQIFFWDAGITHTWGWMFAASSASTNLW